MKLVIEIQMDNAAFAEYASCEVSRILIELATRYYEQGEHSEQITLRDINGNKVGFARVVSDE